MTKPASTNRGRGLYSPLVYFSLFPMFHIVSCLGPLSYAFLYTLIYRLCRMPLLRLYDMKESRPSGAVSLQPCESELHTTTQHMDRVARMGEYHDLT